MTQGKKVVFVASAIIVIIFVVFAAMNLKKTAKMAIMTESGAEAEIPQNISGLSVELLQYGTGDLKVQDGDYILIRYEGKLTDGTVFATNVGSGEPKGIYIGKGEVIPGWDEGLIGMKENEKRKLTISPSMAYGNGGSPKDGVPANSTLVYEIMLFDIIR
jgi:FKBP-type peptidyl-prolyl cis-trans isomerase